MNIDELLRIAVERGASDLHLKVGIPPMMRIDGHLVTIEEKGRITGQERQTARGTTQAARAQVGAGDNVVQSQRRGR